MKGITAGKYCTAALVVCSSLVASHAVAGDKILYLDINEVVEQSYSEGKLDGTVKFYFAGQATPKVASIIDEAITNRKTNAFGKDDRESCRWVMLSALIALQESAKAQGANAVIDITSYYNKVVYKSSSQYECHVGFAMSGVVLKGNYAKLDGK